jgi:drug/metabolite transporter (DMT)-like permease
VKPAPEPGAPRRVDWRRGHPPRPFKLGAVQASPLTSGGLLAVLAAVAFGAVVPFTQRAGHRVGPFFTAALLYAGAALFASVTAIARGGAAPPLRRRDAARVVVIAALGAAVAPALLAWGLQRVAGTAAALLLNFEAVFTVVLARAVWREPFGRRVSVALAAMFAGGGLLMSRAGAAHASTPWGALAVVAATLAWASENVLSRPLAERDPFAVVRAKALLGAIATAAIGLAARESAPAPGRALALAACGAVGFGLSLALYLRAQRQIGAARTGSIFALAPFVGALVAWSLGDRRLDGLTAGAALLFGLGVALHLTERHRHRHRHDETEHEHPHRHDDGHHTHRHEPPVAGEHTHPHRHEAVEHEHEHAPDLHHRHGHG